VHFREATGESMQRTATTKRSAIVDREPVAPKRLLKDYEVEAQYGISRFTLRADRIHARRFKFIKIGRSVYYRVEDIEMMLDNHSVAAMVE
jgi:hypothetical protein